MNQYTDAAACSSWKVCGSATALSSSVAIIADDLTGAADATAMFVERGWSGRVAIDHSQLREPAPGTAQGFDAATRDVTLVSLPPSVRAASEAHLSAADIAFLKVDSLMRGQWAADVARLTSTCRWDRVIVTPAAPRHGRTVVDGALHIDGSLTTHISPQSRLVDMSAPVHHISLSALRSSTSALDQEGVLVVDAETDADLDSIAQTRSRHATLWVGSSGLASALARQYSEVRGSSAPYKRSGPVVILVGSATALAHRQVEAAVRLDESLRSIVLRNGHSHAREANPISEGKNIVAHIAANHTSPHEDRALVDQLVRLVGQAVNECGALVLVGGQTARVACLALGILELEVVGELEAGTIFCTDPYGRVIVTKSGSFGDDLTLHRILRKLTPQ